MQGGIGFRCRQRAVTVMHMLVSRLLAVLVVCLVGCVKAQSLPTWRSDAVGRDVNLKMTWPSGATTRPASMGTVILMQNLPQGPAKSNTFSRSIELLLSNGNAVVAIDYERDSLATADALQRDLLKLRRDLKEKQLIFDPAIDVNRLWILPEGFALKRDVTFYKNDHKTWQLDIAYPIDPPQPVPTLMEITCDNASRMGNFSLVFCHDTLLEGALLRGFAAAMIDHPVPAPYKGLDDPMPELIHRLKAAVRTIRAQSRGLQLNGKIGAIGFSRGGPMAGFLAVTNGRAELEVGGENVGVSSDVQAALVHGNRYDYSTLRSDDPMLARFEKAWGAKRTDQAWLKHGVAFYLRDSAAPMFLNTSATESAEYRDGLARLHELLTTAGVKHHYQIDHDARGHQVATAPETLGAIYAFFHTYLTR